MDSNFPFNNPGEEEEHTVGSFFFIRQQEDLNQKAIWFPQLICVLWCENSISTFLFYTLEVISGNEWEKNLEKKKTGRKWP